MFNILIADDNMIFIKNIVNTLSKINDNIRFYNISTNGSEIVNLIHDGYIDIILLDEEILLKYKILNNLNYFDLEPFPYIILMTKNHHKYDNLNFIYASVNKLNNLSNIVIEINNIIDDIISSNVVKQKSYIIVENLLYLGFSFKYIGTTYLYEVIKLILKCHNKTISYNLEKNIYPLIGKKDYKSASTVKSNILKSIDYMYINCNIDRVMEYFLFSYPTKPTPKIIIDTIISKI